MSNQEIAIIGPTASGKTDLALSVAHKHDALILSLDSLSVYREIDIASAKPTQEERSGIEHFGIDCISIDEKFNAQVFIEEYERAKKEAQKLNTMLIIVGGTSFYLKSLLDGLSDMPNISKENTQKAENLLRDRDEAHRFLHSIDAEHALKIPKNDSFRMLKALELYFETGVPSSKYFKEHPAKPIIEDIVIYNIVTERELLRERIMMRTKKMITMGIIDEAAYLETKYGRAPNAMKSIGIKEVLEFLDGKYDKQTLLEQIATHTAQLAKRQTTFNNGQFSNSINGTLEELLKRLI